MSVEVVSAQRTTRRALDTLREQLAPEANDDELTWLAAVGQRLGLDPIAGHLVLIPRWDGRAGRRVHRPQITADGRLVLAERTGELDGFDGPEWTGARDTAGNHRWVDLWDDDEPPHAARCIVYRRGRTHPANGTVRWREFAQYAGNPPKLIPTWLQMPSHMLGKVALSLGLRRAFGDVIPSDVELDDDFAPYEREQRLDTATGELLDASTADDLPGEGTRATSRRPTPASAAAAPVALPPDELVRRAEALPDEQRAAFRAFRESRKLPWPTESRAVIVSLSRELERLEVEARDEADAYEPGGAASSSPPTDDTTSDDQRGRAEEAPSSDTPDPAATVRRGYEPPIGSSYD